jgi:hypothetical protein
MIEAERTCETLVNFYQTTRRYNPEDSHLQTHKRVCELHSEFFERHCTLKTTKLLRQTTYAMRGALQPLCGQTEGFLADTISQYDLFLCPCMLGQNNCNMKRKNYYFLVGFYYFVIEVCKDLNCNV